MRELLPCPFCGGEAIFRCCVHSDYYEHVISCSDCAAATITLVSYKKDLDKDEENHLVERWNRRNIGIPVDSSNELRDLFINKSHSGEYPSLPSISYQLYRIANALEALV